LRKIVDKKITKYALRSSFLEITLFGILRKKYFGGILEINLALAKETALTTI